MDADLRIRAARPDDVDAIVELQRVGLGEGTLPRSVEAWRWKHVDNPFGSSFVLVAESAGRLVGLRAFMAWRFIDGARVVRAVRAVDTVTHPDWQGRGVFTRLTRALLDEVATAGVELVFNTPNDKSRPGYLKLGWHDLGRLTVWGRPLRPRVISRAHDALPASDALLTLVVNPQPSQGLQTPTDAAFLRWRYGAVPGIDYRAVVDGDGAAVGRRRRRGRFVEAMITEVVVGEGVAGIARAARAVRLLGRALDAAYAIAVAPIGSRRALVLAGAGFVPVPRAGPHFTVRPSGAHVGAARGLSLREWALGLGDIELF